MPAWSGYGFDGCEETCECGGPCPCAVSDDFASDSISDYDVTGTFAVAGGVLTASTAGDCYQALQLPALGKEAGVKATVINDSHAMFGVFLGRGANGPEANNRVELLWDVANAQVLARMWVAGTLVYDEAFAGNPTSTLRITVSGVTSGWIFKFYRDGIELDPGGSPFGPAFEATGWFAAGVTCDNGGGTWDDLCLQSCDPLCELTTTCSSAITAPISWVLDGGEIVDGSGNLDGELGGIDYYTEDCIHCGGEHTLIKESVGYRWDGATSGSHCEAWQTSLCTWRSSIYSPDGQAPPADCDPVPASVGGWWASYIYYAAHPAEPPDPPLGPTTDGWESGTVWQATIVSLGGGMYRINVACRVIQFRGDISGFAAIYVSPSVTTGHDYAAGGPVTLTLNGQTPPSNNWCNWPSTITLTPNGDGVKFTGAGCLPDETEGEDGFMAMGATAGLIGPNDGSQCEHRGELIEVRKCDTCGNRQKKEPVYQCSLYGECSDWDRFSSVRACRWCQDFTPRTQIPRA